MNVPCPTSRACGDAPQRGPEPPTANGSEEPYRRRLVTVLYVVFFSVCAVAALTPLWLGKYPPMVDVPQHAAQVALWQQLAAPQSKLHALFELNYATPYLVGYALTRAVAEVSSVLVGMKVTLSLAVLGLAASLHVLMRQAQRPVWWSLAGLVLAYNVNFHWGFFNYMVAAPLGLLMMAASLHLARTPTRAAWWTLLAAACATLAAHALAFGFGAAVCAAVLAARAKSWRQAAFHIGALVPAGVLALVWLGLGREHGSIDHLPVIWNLGLWRVVELAALQLATDGSDKLALAVGAAIWAAVLVSGRGLSAERWRWVPAAVGLMLFLVFPWRWLGVGVLYPRFAVLLLPLVILASKGPSRGGQRALAVLLVALVLGWSGVLHARVTRFNQQAAGYDAIASRMKPGLRVRPLIYMRQTEAMAGPAVFVHFPAWYQVSHGGVVGFSFAISYASLVRYRDDVVPAMAAHAEWVPEQFDCTRELPRYDLFVVRGTRAQMPACLRNEQGAKLLAQRDMWWLFERAPQRAPFADR